GCLPPIPARRSRRFSMRPFVASHRKGTRRSACARSPGTPASIMRSSTITSARRTSWSSRCWMPPIAACWRARPRCTGRRAVSPRNGPRHVASMKATWRRASSGCSTNCGRRACPTRSCARNSLPACSPGGRLCAMRWAMRSTHWSAMAWCCRRHSPRTSSRAGWRSSGLAWRSSTCSGWTRRRLATGWRSMPSGNCSRHSMRGSPPSRSSKEDAMNPKLHDSFRKFVGELPFPGRLPADHAGPFETIRPAREGHVERDGVKCWYAVWGDAGPWLAFASPFQMVHSQLLKATVPYLSSHCRVITTDNRGNGRSDRPRDPDAYSFDHYFADFVGVLDAVGADRVALVAISAAAMTVLRLAAEQPERVSHVVIAGGFAETQLAVPRLVDLARAEQERIRADWPAYIEEFISTIFTEPHSTKPFEDGVRY